MDGMDDLAVHGLWPAYSTAKASGKTYPQFCAKTHEKLNSGRERHEWQKHGSCTPLKVGDYFDFERVLEENEAISRVRDLLNDSAGESANITDVYDEIGGNKKVAIMTNKFCQLQEITTCWEKLSDGRVGELIECPNHVLGSSRNSAVLQGCRQIALDQSESKCAFISKELLNAMKFDSK